MYQDIEILVIEDDEDILELIEYHLQKKGFRVAGFLRPDKVEAFLNEEEPHLMVVDRNLPGIEGSELVASLRQKGFDIPVIFLTAKDKESDLIEGFERGGDDYMSKPFSPNELIARIVALLKRSGAIKEPQKKLRHRDLVLECDLHLVYVEGNAVELTPLESRLLEVFMQNKHRILERDMLRDAVWGKDEDFYEKTINVTINRLKRKIDPSGKKGYFEAVRGVGYRLI